MAGVMHTHSLQQRQLSKANVGVELLVIIPGNNSPPWQCGTPP
jgi:hypothetical protein